MEKTSLSQSIRSGFLEAVSELAAGEVSGTCDSGLRGPSLIREQAKLRSRDACPEERGRLWKALLGSYRAGPSRLWGPIVLEALAPALLRALAKYKPVLPFIAEEDVSQQMVLEVLQAAADMPLPGDATLIPRAIVRRAEFRLLRGLRREIRNRAGGEEVLVALSNRRAVGIHLQDLGAARRETGSPRLPECTEVTHRIRPEVNGRQTRTKRAVLAATEVRVSVH